MEPVLFAQNRRVPIGDVVKMKQWRKIKHVRVEVVFPSHKNLQQFKVRMLNSQSETQVSEKQLILTPDKDFDSLISDIPDHSSKVTPDEIIGPFLRLN